MGANTTHSVLLHTTHSILLPYIQYSYHTLNAPTHHTFHTLNGMKSVLYSFLLYLRVICVTHFCQTRSTSEVAATHLNVIGSWSFQSTYFCVEWYVTQMAQQTTTLTMKVYSLTTDSLRRHYVKH